MNTSSPNTPAGPYQDTAANSIYALLFGDDPRLIQASADATPGSLWSVLTSAATAESDLRQIAEDLTLETRVRLMAYHILRTNDYPVGDRDLLAVIVEVGMDEGLDVLAAYLDGTARYINYTGKMIIWDAPDQTSREITHQLFGDSKIILGRIGPWDGPRRPYPPKGVVRISFLAADGLYFGEGQVNVLFNDALAAPALSSATALMQYLVNSAEKQQI